MLDGEVMNELLIEYLEKETTELYNLKKKLDSVKKQYKKFYQKDIKDELKILSNEFSKRKFYLRMHLFEHFDELKSIKKYYPELYSEFLNDSVVGDILKKMDWILDVKPLSFPIARARLSNVKLLREQLRDAKSFLIKKWYGDVNTVSFGATYPVLKEEFSSIKKSKMDKEEVLTLIDEIDKKLKKEGWKIILSSPELSNYILSFFLNRLRLLYPSLINAKKRYEQSKGKGSTIEYSSLKYLKQHKYMNSKDGVTLSSFASIIIIFLFMLSSVIYSGIVLYFTHNSIHLYFSVLVSFTFCSGSSSIL